MDIDAVIEAINIEQDTMNSLHAKLWAMRDERDALLSTLACLRELLPKGRLERAAGYARCEAEDCEATWKGIREWEGREERADAVALRAAAALLWPGEG